MRDTKWTNVVAICLLLIGSSACHAGTILWDGAQLRNDPYNCDYSIWWCDDDWVFEAYHLRLDYGLDVSAANGLVSITFIPFENLGGGSDWVVSALGEIADESTTRHQDAFLFDGGLDGSNGGVHADYPLVVADDGPQSAYLAFAYSNISYDSIFNPTAAPVFYGWLELSIDGEDISIVHSAIDISGDPIVVGMLPVPEPSSFALVALGIAILAARRKVRERARSFQLDS